MSIDKLSSVKQQVRRLVQNLTENSYRIIREARDSEDAGYKIMRVVSREVSEKTTGFLGEMYTVLSEDTLASDIFQDTARANAFYDLDLDSKIFSSYMFEVKDIDEYCPKAGMGKLRDIYFGVGAAVGTLALGSILIAGLGKQSKVPFIVLVAASIATGLLSFLKFGNVYDKMKFKFALRKYMTELESELIQWIEGIEKYYNDEVMKLVNSFEV